MSLFSWLFPKRKKPKADTQGAALSQMDVTRPEPRRGASAASAAGAQPVSRTKGERMVRRELLYAVVREAMVRAGVLSAGYKFKVLSLDGKGLQFMVMIDLSREYGGGPARLAEIEALIAQSAKSRHGIVVTAVYWRMNEHVAVGDPGAAQKQRADSAAPAESDSAPSPLESRPTPLFAPEARRPIGRYEPIQADEVAAFKSALAAGRAGLPLATATATATAAAAASAVVTAAMADPNSADRAGARAFDGSGKHGPQSYTLLTGYEDTEVSDGDTRTPVLSGTQYGELN